jgi:hypothetical protein
MMGEWVVQRIVRHSPTQYDDGLVVVKALLTEGRKFGLAISTVFPSVAYDYSWDQAISYQMDLYLKSYTRTERYPSEPNTTVNDSRFTQIPNILQ